MSINTTKLTKKAMGLSAFVFFIFAIAICACSAANDLVRIRVPVSYVNRVSIVQDANIQNRLDYGDFSIIDVPKETVDKLKAAGIRFQIEKNSQSVLLENYAIDITNPPKLPAELLASAKSGVPGLFLVKMHGPVKKAWLDRMRSLGAQIVGYVPKDTYLVWTDPAILPKMHSFGIARWTEPYHPAFKIAKQLESAKIGKTQIAVIIFNDKSGSTIQRIVSLGAKLIRKYPINMSTNLPSERAIFSVDTSAIIKIAHLPKVVRIEPASLTAGLDDEKANQLLVGHHINGIPYSNPSYSDWLQQIGFDGTGSIISIVDTGCDTNNNTTVHQDLRGRLSTIYNYPLSPDTDISGHGTHVAGIAAGSGALGLSDNEGFLYGMGIAPGASLVIQNAVASILFPPMDGWSVLTTDSLQAGALLSNNSWYSNATPGLGYTSICAEFDSLVRDGDTSTSGLQPITLIFSAGNAGPAATTMLEPKEAKNIISVGASENYRPDRPLGQSCGTGDNFNGIVSFSSRGPCVDGRIAPTVVAPGSHIASTASYSASYPSECKDLIAGTNGSYAWMSGTSMSAPIVSGALAIISQWWRSTHSGTNPSPAMCKAIIINGADDIAGGPDGRGGTLDHIPNGDQGWGRLNIAACVNPANTYYDDQSKILTATGQSCEYKIRAADPNKPLKITLVWTDPPGTPGSYALVNDLDLEVTAGSDTYLGNVFQNGWSVTGGVSDQINNVECVYIQNPSGEYIVKVIAADICGDGVPGNGIPLDQDYALVISNGVLGGNDLQPYVPVQTNNPPKPDYYKAIMASGGWSAVGLKPSAPSDHDISLYSDPGYLNLLASSTLRGSNVDIIACDGNKAATGTIYPEVINFAGSDGYTIEWASSKGLMTPGIPVQHTFTSNSVLATWDIQTSAPSQCGLRAQITAGNADIGICVFNSQQGSPATYFRSRSQALAESNSAGSGESETLVCDLPNAGRYGIVIYSSSGSGTINLLSDLTPPGGLSVTPEAAYTIDLSRLAATWSASDPESGIAYYEYCIGTSAGASDIVGWTNVGLSTGIVKTGLTLSIGTNYYFTVRATNNLGMTSTASSSAILACQAISDIPSAKGLPDGSAVALSPKVVSARFADRFYISENNRSSGIGIKWTGTVTEGHSVTVAGRLATADGERFIEAVSVSEQ